MVPTFTWETNRARRGISSEFSTIGPTMVAVLIVAVLGTVLNDAGIWVWVFVSGVALFPALWFWARTWPRPAESSTPASPRR